MKIFRIEDACYPPGDMERKPLETPCIVVTKPFHKMWIGDSIVYTDEGLRLPKSDSDEHRFYGINFLVVFKIGLEYIEKDPYSNSGYNL